MAGRMAVLLLLVTATVAATATTLGELSRRETGDVFTLYGEQCGPSQCAEHGAGTAGNGANVGPTDSPRCSCVCPQRAPLFREDRELCVDDLPECSLATFGTGSSVQRIPFVYLPLKGQIIHPSRDIVFPNVKTPICAVSGAQFLTRKGFLDLRNTLDADVPFTLFRDEGRTFLQWTGEDEVRARMTGRVMVVRLLCRDVSAMPSSPLDLRGVFTPCVAFRVQGAPPKYTNNITEMLFTPNAQTSDGSSSGLSVAEYVAIGISSLLLGLIYVASVFLYLHIKKRRKATIDANNARILKNLKSNGGSPITERDIIRISNERVTLPSVMGQDDGVVKKNPLLNVGRHFYDKNVSNDMSDCEDNGDSLRSDGKVFKNSTISAIIHQRADQIRQIEINEYNHREEQNIERLPDEHVSIVETIDDREIARPVGTTRRKLYFNPAYFEPHLMADPPAAALEFLSKIREVIAIAKQKMAAKRFQPVLNEIPEEETYPSYENSLEYYHRIGSQRSGSIVSLKRENSRKKSINCLGCPGCQSNNNNDIQTVIPFNPVACTNCRHSKGELQNNIRKWLENIPNDKQPLSHNEIANTNNQNTLATSLLSLPLTMNNYSTNPDSDNYNSINDFIIPKRPRSVNSEPIKNYNIPLPDFNVTKTPTSFNRCQTVSRMHDINPNYDCRGGSLRYSTETNKLLMRALMKNKNTLPDMVNEAVELDKFSKTSYNLSSSDDERLYKDNVVNDYETDSLERTSKKDKCMASDVTDIPSSQASPSLSTALPLEEELTIRNDIYKVNCSSNSNTPSPDSNLCIDQDHYEIVGLTKPKNQKDLEGTCNTIKKNTDYNLVSEVYVNNNYNFGSAPTSPSGSECSMGSRKYIALDSIQQTPGSLTIEVKDPPENYIKIHESDGFEPDTLDRKCSKQKDTLQNIQLKRIEALKNEEAEHKPKQRIQLKSSGTFSLNSLKGDSMNRCNSLRNDQSTNRHTLSHVYSGSKSLDSVTDDGWEETLDWASEEGRILTLELRHSKRQRQCTPPTIKQIKSLPRPDVLPPLPPTEIGIIYEKPINPPRRVDNSAEFEHNCNGVTTMSPKPRQTIVETQDNLHSLTMSPYSSLQAFSMPSSQVFSGPSSRSDYEEVNVSNNYNNEGRMKEDQIDDYSGSNEKVSDNVFTNNRINTNTFVKGCKIDSGTRTKLRRKKGFNIDDSGYLSSDSTSSKPVNPKIFQKKIVVAKVISCSESDDTENEARSESGAESVETHSVYFDNNYKDKKHNDIFNTRVRSLRDKKCVKN